MKKIGIKEVVATGIGTALFVVLTEVQIPLVVISNTSLQIRAALLAFLAAVHGPVVGFCVGLIGHSVGDWLFYDGTISWNWVFADAIFGLIVGIFANKYHIKEGKFLKKQIIIFNIVQIIANAIAWLIIAPVLDIIKGDDVALVFEQGGLAFISNIIIIAVLGTLLCVAYTYISTNNGIGKR